MKINSQNSGVTSSTASSKTVAADVSLAKPAVSTASEVSVASHLQTGGMTAAEAPFDSQRVAEIRQAIIEGRFQVNADKIADTLLTGVRELLRDGK
jgi:negative regulator of flagellin synthesis FlgM